jgi:hypothetical protein
MLMFHKQVKFSSNQPLGLGGVFGWQFCDVARLVDKQELVTAQSIFTIILCMSHTGFF